MEDNINNFCVLSKGVLKGSFVFEADYYAYVERKQNSPMDNKYNVTTLEEKATNALFEVKLQDGFLSVSIIGLNIENNRCFPTVISSKLVPYNCSISEPGEEDFQVLSMALPDLNPQPRGHSHMRILFRKGMPVSLGFVFSNMSEDFHIYEQILDVDGKLKYYIEND